MDQKSSNIVPYLISIIKDDETIRKTLLTNTCKMMIARGYLDKTLWTNEKINKFVEKKNDNNIYEVPTNVNIKNNSPKNTNFDGSKFYITIIPQKVMDTGNSPIFLDFMKTYNNYFKIVIFDSISDKAHNNFRRKPNLDAFEKDFLMINLPDYKCAPISYEVLSPTDLSFIKNERVSKLLHNDPATLYYGLKKGQIVRIIRKSHNGSRSIAYRKVVTGHIKLK